MTKPQSSTRSLKFWGILTLKLALVVGIFIWLIQKGHIDLAAFQNISWGKHSVFLFLAAACIFTNMVLQTFRAKWLFDAQKYHVPFKEFFIISWISYFFCAFLPGGVTSDVVKYGYLHRSLNRSRTITALVLLIDRASGLVSLVVLTFVASCLAIWQAGSYSEPLFKLWYFALFILIGTGILILLALHPTIHNISWLRPLYRFRIFQSLTQALATYHTQRHVLWAALGISVLGQGLYLTSIYFLQHLLYADAVFSLLAVFALFPTAIFAAVIPIAPQGFGVSQVALVSLAAILQIPHASVAVTLFTTIQIIAMLCFLTGAIPYIGYKQGKVKSPP